MNIDSFGTTFVVDKATNVVLCDVRLNQIGKLIVRSMLDTAAIQLQDRREFDLLSEESTVATKGGRFFVATLSDSDMALVTQKRTRASLLRSCAYLLYEQAGIIWASYDGLTDLDVEDLPLYEQHTVEFTKVFAETRGLPYNLADKHLQFCHKNLLEISLRKKELIWRHSVTLQSVFTIEDAEKWKQAVLLETVGLGAI